MQRKAALFPNYMAARQFDSLFALSDQSSSECLTAYAPVKQSPAPTVSIILKSLRTSGLTVVAVGAQTATWFVMMAEPLLPSFSSTLSFGCLVNSFTLISCVTAYRLNSSPISIVSSILLSSVSFGEMQEIQVSSYSVIGESCPPQSRITTFPLFLAYLAAARTRDMGVSFWRRRQSHWSMTSLKAGSMSSRSWYFMLAPPYITIEFSPCWSTYMQAIPVGQFSSTRQWSSTCAPSISFLSRRWASSLPTWPMNQLLPASLPTETAWLAPLPPLAVRQLRDWTVSPFWGISLTQRKWSALALPKMQIFFLGDSIKLLIQFWTQGAL